MSHGKPVLKEAYWVGLPRAGLKRKGSPLDWEKAHTKIRGNELEGQGVTGRCIELNPLRSTLPDIQAQYTHNRNIERH